jgi:hypothetical protein
MVFHVSGGSSHSSSSEQALGPIEFSNNGFPAFIFSLSCSNLWDGVSLWCDFRFCGDEQVLWMSVFQACLSPANSLWCNVCTDFCSVHTWVLTMRVQQWEFLYYGYKYVGGYVMGIISPVLKLCHLFTS